MHRRWSRSSSIERPTALEADHALRPRLPRAGFPNSTNSPKVALPVPPAVVVVVFCPLLRHASTQKYTRRCGSMEGADVTDSPQVALARRRARGRADNPRDVASCTHDRETLVPTAYNGDSADRGRRPFGRSTEPLALIAKGFRWCGWGVLWAGSTPAPARRPGNLEEPVPATPFGVWNSRHTAARRPADDTSAEDGDLL